MARSPGPGCPAPSPTKSDRGQTAGAGEQSPQRGTPPPQSPVPRARSRRCLPEIPTLAKGSAAIRVPAGDAPRAATPRSLARSLAGPAAVGPAAPRSERPAAAGGRETGCSGPVAPPPRQWKMGLTALTHAGPPPAAPPRPARPAPEAPPPPPPQPGSDRRASGGLDPGQRRGFSAPSTLPRPSSAASPVLSRAPSESRRRSGPAEQGRKLRPPHLMAPVYSFRFLEPGSVTSRR
nr:uncharacterized protein LOC116158193 [Camelus dromedarius]